MAHVQWIVILALAAAALILWFRQNWLRQRFQRLNDGVETEKLLLPQSRDDSSEGSQGWLDDFDKIRTTYHQLHHLESNPGIRAVARETLLCALDRAVAHETACSEKMGISQLKYSRETLSAWIMDRDRSNMQKFENYTIRRKDGGSRELLEHRAAAEAWLKKQAPLRYVDGAWLGRIARARSPWRDQETVRQLWQILSEELGDGDVAKHHTYLYHQLLRSIDPGMPLGHSREFLDSKWGANTLSVWRAGLIQLVISMFQEDFLPEILGFNLHFEGLTPEMMIAAVEMRELRLDPMYFMLHVSVDNADSGHTAMALNATCDYLERCRNLDGTVAAAQVWKRIQAGYLLSAGKWNTDESLTTNAISSSKEIAVAEIFARKAEAGSHVHCASPARLGGRRIVDWLDPRRMVDASWARQLVRELGKSRVWIMPGNVAQSRFMKELLWPGRMFGAFTDSECRTVEHWIQELPALCQGTSVSPVSIYQPAFGTQEPSAIENLTKLHANYDETILTIHDTYDTESCLTNNGSNARLDSTALRSSPHLPLLWFAHLSLLEGLVALPSKSCTPLAQSALRILRAQYGLGQPSHSVTGTDSCNELTEHASRITLVEIGIQLLDSYGLSCHQSLDDLLGAFPGVALAETVIGVSSSPVKSMGTLLGMAAGFVPLYRALATSGILDTASSQQLLAVADVHAGEVAYSLRELETETVHYQGFLRGSQYITKSLSDMYANQD